MPRISGEAFARRDAVRSNCAGGDVVERGVAPDVVEAVDIAGNGLRGLVTGIEDVAPDELDLIVLKNVSTIALS